MKEIIIEIKVKTDWFIEDKVECSGAVMLKKHPDDTRGIKDVVDAYFGAGDLTTRPLLRSDYAQFLLLCSAYPDKAITVPALQISSGCNAEMRFNRQSLRGKKEDVFILLIESSACVCFKTFFNAFLNDSFMSSALSLPEDMA